MLQLKVYILMTIVSDVNTFLNVDVGICERYKPHNYFQQSILDCPKINESDSLTVFGLSCILQPSLLSAVISTNKKRSTPFEKSLHFSFIHLSPTSLRLLLPTKDNTSISRSSLSSSPLSASGSYWYYTKERIYLREAIKTYSFTFPAF